MRLAARNELEYKMRTRPSQMADDMLRLRNRLDNAERIMKMMLPLLAYVTHPKVQLVKQLIEEWLYDGAGSSSAGDLYAG